MLSWDRKSPQLPPEVRGVPECPVMADKNEPKEITDAGTPRCARIDLRLRFGDAVADLMWSVRTPLGKSHVGVSTRASGERNVCRRP